MPLQDPSRESSFSLGVLGFSSFEQSMDFGTSPLSFIQKKTVRISESRSRLRSTKDSSISSIDYAVNKSRLATTLRGVSNHPLAMVAQNKLDTRKRDKNKSSYSDICSKFLEGQNKYPQLVKQHEILGIIMSAIGAGADTTAGTLTYTLHFLSKHPAARQKLMDEIDENLSQGTLSRTPKWVEVNRMPYLDAVLGESMRLLPIASWGLDRVVPPAGATVAGQLLPGGTVVGCQIDAVHRDKEVYGKDSDDYRAERWIEAGIDQRRQMDRAFLAFGAGKRTCTGVHIAWLEMKKTLPLLMMNFDPELVNPNQDVKDGIRISTVKYSPPIPMKITRKSY
ncbi:hypothetical protein NW762_006192 [Fusarium torreyae]|uniref:Cytochrome P450 monooxygenase n=1 Tax=Fusarium torreyae TaxID=1237075 RepID=A0A9W8VE53_9HYPO|nr:hypothetical protein NW762_006192 [Fusarium torreyae]